MSSNITYEAITRTIPIEQFRPNADDLAGDYAWCKNIIMQHSSSFYRAFRVMRQDKADAVFAVYAFCRLADDAIDVHGNTRLLDQLEAGLDQFAAGAVPDTRLWRALGDTILKWQLPLKPFYDMLTGQRRDAVFQQPQTMADLLDYCYYVAGTVGLMVLPLICEKPDATTRTLALDLGTAMQLTNILRDIGSDLKLDRIYIPKTLMKQYGVSESDLAADPPTSHFISLWEALAKTADQKYQHVYRHLQLFDHEGRLPLLLSLLYYQKILEKARRGGYRVSTRRAYLSDARKVLIMLNARLIRLKLKYFGQSSD